MKPILFNTPMVQAILDGRKTMTRRVVKFPEGNNPNWTGYIPDGGVLYGSNNVPVAKSPYRPGDILWVRETWAQFCLNKNTCPNSVLAHSDWCYKASPEECMDKFPCRWHPSIFMPKEAARIFLRVTDVRVERVRDITEEDAKAEGIEDDAAFECNGWFPSFSDPDSGGVPAYSIAFSILWDGLNAKRGYGWNANPWVWVYRFERFGKPIDA